MDKRQRFTLLGIAAAIAVVAVVVALVAGGGDDEGSNTTPATQATQTQPQQQAGGDTTTEQGEPPEAEIPRIRVKDGKPLAGVEKISAKKDDVVEFEVRANVADQAHLHGYDISKDVGPGKSARFRFKADIEGVFELELHDTGEEIAQITVEP